MLDPKSGPDFNSNQAPCLIDWRGGLTAALTAASSVRYCRVASKPAEDP